MLHSSCEGSSQGCEHKAKDGSYARATVSLFSWFSFLNLAADRDIDS